jgi:SAM-dependent methyltransferase
MSGQIIGLQEWFQTPPGRYLLAWEQSQFDQAVTDLFGYHALQLGVAEIDGLRANRISHRWLALPGTFDPAPSVPSAPPRVALISDSTALPFSANSLDLVLLPHTLELSPDPHATLREVERVLVPEGRVVICGLNPASLWGLRQRRARLYKKMGFGQLFLPETGDFLSYWRLRDWLRLLSFEVESSRFGIYRPGMRDEVWLERFRWLDPLGDRWWPIFGAVYFVVAVKRVRGMTLLGAEWKRTKALAKAPVPVTGKMHRDLDIKNQEERR